MGAVRVGVVGVGYFGALHAEKLARIEGARLIAVVDADAARAQAIAARHGVAALVDPAALIGHVDAAIVAVPTRAHYEVASLLLEGGVHLLVEKPITDDPATARALVELAAARRVVLQVGHLERFSAVALAVRERIRDPLYIEAHRIAPFRDRGTDVSVTLDLMIHDIDLVLAFIRAPIESVEAIGVPVLSPSEDIVNTRLRFANGCFATMTASRVSLKAERKMRIFQPDCYLGIDFMARSVRLVERHPDAPNAPVIAERSFEEGDALLTEDTAFIAAVAGRTPPFVSGADGLRAVEAAALISASLKENFARLARARGLSASAGPAGPELSTS
jgi:predicted dehydrogenase